MRKVGGICRTCGATVEVSFEASAVVTLFAYCNCKGDAGVMPAPGYPAVPMALMLLDKDGS